MVGACSRGENRGKGRVATKHDSLGTAKLLHRSRNLGETFTYLALTTSVWIRDRSLGDTSQAWSTFRRTIHAGVCRRPYLVPRDSTPAERMPFCLFCFLRVFCLWAGVVVGFVVFFCFF